MVMMSLPRAAAPVAVWKPACGSKEKELHGLPAGDLLIGKTLYRSAAGFGGDQTILNQVKNLTLS